MLGKTWAGRKTTTTTTTTAHVNHEYMQDNLQISKTVIIKQGEMPITPYQQTAQALFNIYCLKA